MSEVSSTHPGSPVLRQLRRAFLAVGILPFLLLIIVVLFASVEPRFLTAENLLNAARQSVYLVIISAAQMLVLLTGNFELSVGSNVALTSVIVTMTVGAMLRAVPEAPTLAMAAGVLAGLGVGLVIGVLNGFGVAVMRVHSFITTLGMMSIVFGTSLTITGGLPVYGIPDAFGQFFAYGRVFGIPAPVLFGAFTIGLLYVLLSWTPLGRQFYAVGSNLQAARLSGINTTLVLFLAHVLCGVVTAFAGILLTARLGSGESGLGENYPLMSITACVLGGVSLVGGIGRIGSVVLGAFFITLLTNGMNMSRVSSYAQIIVIGSMLIAAVWADQLRLAVMRGRPRN